MLKKTAFFLLIFTGFYNANGSLKDSLNYYLKTKKPELIGGLSSRNTFIGSTKTAVNGIAGGYNYGGKISFMSGIYWLAKPMEERRVLDAFTAKAYTVDEKSVFWYLGISGDYVFCRKGNWTLDIPIRLGIGSASVKQYSVSSDRSFLNKKTSSIFPVESGVNALYKLSWWIGLSGGLGSRIVFGKNNAQKFSGTYYNLGITVFLGDIYHHVRRDMKNNPVEKHRK